MRVLLMRVLIMLIVISSFARACSSIRHHQCRPSIGALQRRYAGTEKELGMLPSAFPSLRTNADTVLTHRKRVGSIRVASL